MNSNVLMMLPARYRQLVYIIYGLALIAVNTIDAYFGDHDPTWLPAVMRAMQTLGIPVLAIAAVNVQRTPAEANAKPLASRREAASGWGDVEEEH